MLGLEEADVRAIRQEMVEKSGQTLSPCVEIDGHMLADVSGEEVETYLLARKLVQPNDLDAEAPINEPCAHQKVPVVTRCET